VPYQVNHDYISLTLIAIAVTVFLYSAVWTSEMSFKSLLAAVMLIAGFAFSFGFRYATVSRVPGKLWLWSLMAFGFIIIANFVVKIFPVQATTTATAGPVSWSLFGMLVAVGEEQWFRGFLTPFICNLLGSIWGIVLSGLVFGIYHFAVYGTDMTALVVVTMTGMALSYVAIQTKSVTPGMAAHVLNNFIATMGWI
jgi:membrane protease YdiL (CAAX protease family)